MDLLGLRLRHHKRRLLNRPTLFQLNDFGRLVMIVLLGLSLGFGLPPALATKQVPAEGNQHEKTFEIDPAGIELKIKEINKRLTEAIAAENEQTARQLGVTLAQVQERTIKLRDLETIYQRTKSAYNVKKSVCGRPSLSLPANCEMSGTLNCGLLMIMA